jgi:uncharacterized protein YdeI (YjbR/CyaY-like superfamily)
MNQVDAYCARFPDKKPILERVISLLRSTSLEETIKWGMPTYTLEGKILIGVGAFKEHVAIWFHQGVFLKDPKRVLQSASPGKTKALRQWRLYDEKDLDESAIARYIEEAILNAEKGKEIKPERKPLVIPDELERAFREIDGLKVAFFALPEGKQKEFADYIGEAVREGTRLSRLRKSVPMIQDGVGLNDRYK